MPMILKPLALIVEMMSPVAFFATASGLMIAKVRWSVFILLSLYKSRSLARRLGMTTKQLSAHCAFSERLHERLADHGWRFRDADACSLKRFDLFSRSAMPAGDDRAGVSHAAARRRGLSRDECHHRLLHMLLHVFGRSFFVGAADLADHDD